MAKKKATATVEMVCDDCKVHVRMTTAEAAKAKANTTLPAHRDHGATNGCTRGVLVDGEQVMNEQWGIWVSIVGGMTGMRLDCWCKDASGEVELFDSREAAEERATFYNRQRPTTSRGGYEVLRFDG